MNDQRQMTHLFTPLLKAENLLKKRVMAFTIDLFCIVFTAKILALSYSLFLRTFAYPLYNSIGSTLPHLSAALEAVGMLALYGAYFFLCLYLSQGKTLGKVVMGLRVVSRETPGEYTLWQAIGRTSGYYVGYFTGMVVFGLCLTNRRQAGLHDWLSDSQVISEDQWREILRFEQDMLRLQGLSAARVELFINGHDESSSIAS